MANQSKSNEQYEGPGRIASAISLLFPAFIVSVGSVIPFLKNVVSGDLHDLHGPLMKIKGAKLAIVGLTTGVCMAAYGVFSGWRNAAKGEEQFNALKSERNEAHVRNEALQTQVAGLNEEVATYRKRFSDGVPSRSAHGSHGAAAEVDKASADVAAAR